MRIARVSASIVAVMGTHYRAEDVLMSGNHLFTDAMRKACVMHLIAFSEQLPINSLKVIIDGVESRIDNTPVLTSLIPQQQLVWNVPPGVLTPPVAHRLLKTSVSKANGIDAALHAYLYAKSKALKTDRLLCLWTAMNGVYNTAAAIVKMHAGQGPSKHIRETEKLRWFMRINDLGSRYVSPDVCPPLASEVIAVLRKGVETVTRDDLESGEIGLRIARAIAEKAPNFDITPYGYVLLGLSYHFRCRLFHGSTPLPLYAQTGDGNNASMQVCNDILEDYLDENLFFWLDETHVASVIERKVTHEFGHIR